MQSRIRIATFAGNTEFPIKGGLRSYGAVYSWVALTLDQRYVPVLIANNCLAALPAQRALEDRYGSHILWFDAHGDYRKTSTDESRMALSLMVGNSDKSICEGYAPVRTNPRMVTHIGGISFDGDERERMAADGIQFHIPRFMPYQYVHVHVDMSVTESFHVEAIMETVRMSGADVDLWTISARDLDQGSVDSLISMIEWS